LPTVVFDQFGFEKLINLGICEAEVGAEINAQDIAAIAHHEALKENLETEASICGRKRVRERHRLVDPYIEINMVIIIAESRQICTIR